ncbi:MAG: 3-dehydroquinate synthase [Eubacterium sp.]|nr:3-dehydroquinate synthase [Eubacterium sp.]
MEFSYEIVWQNSFPELAECLAHAGLQPGKICIVTDTNIAPLYLEAVEDALKEFPAAVFSYIMPAGEQHKNLDTVRALYTFLIEEHFERKDLLIALGGGVVGDLTGFTASTYLRGIDFVQVPTTLLAQVDSSVGGKTGVDFDQYKNMVGAFHQPRLVYMNPETLRTLPGDQFASGMAEIIKSALICDSTFFDWLEEHNKQIRDKEPDALTHMIRTCCAIKARVVAEDPKETGLRAILNYGHTVGHAIEKLSNFRMLHGHCVALGMLAALSVDQKRGTIQASDLLRIRALLAASSLPLYTSGLEAEAVLNAMRSDKKMEAGRIKFVLLREIGSAEICRTLTDSDLLDAVQEVVRA